MVVRLVLVTLVMLIMIVKNRKNLVIDVRLLFFIVGNDEELSVGSNEKLAVEIKKKNQLLRDMQGCYRVSLSTLLFFECLNQERPIISDVIFFLDNIKSMMKELTDKYKNTALWPSYSDLILIEHQKKIADENVPKDASVMWSISRKRVPQSAMLYLVLYEIKLTKEYVIGECISELEYEDMTQLLRAIYSLKRVYKTWGYLFGSK